MAKRPAPSTECKAPATITTVLYSEEVDKESMCSCIVESTDVMAKSLPVEEQLKMQLSYGLKYKF